MFVTIQYSSSVIMGVHTVANRDTVMCTAAFKWLFGCSDVVLMAVVWAKGKLLELSS